MSRRFTPKVISANDLLEGDVVWLTADDRWSRDMAEAELLTDEAHAEIRLLHARSQGHVVVDANYAEAAPSPIGPVPTHFREAFRTRGPTNYPLGKQAEGLTPRGQIPGETSHV